MGYYNYRFKNGRHILFAFIILWIMCLTITITSAILRLPPNADISALEFSTFTLVGTTVLAPFALPTSFADTLGLTSSPKISRSEHSGHEVFIAMSFYWPILFFMFYLLFKTKLVFIYLLICSIFIISSLNWLSVSIEFMLI